MEKNSQAYPSIVKAITTNTMIKVFALKKQQVPVVVVKQLNTP